MPRVKPLTENDRKNRTLRGELMGNMRQERMTFQQLADLLGISDSTLHRRMENPDGFTLKEIRKIRALFPEIRIE